MTAANRDPALADALEARDTQSEPDHARAADEKARQDKPQEDLGHGGLDGQHAAHGATARPEGSVADTGTRTDDPVGTGQVESRAVHAPGAEADSDRQEQPPKATPDANRGETSTKAGPAASDNDN